MAASGDFATYLEPGERVVWSARPVQGVRLRAADFFLIPFSLLWGGFAIFWETMATSISFLASGKAPEGTGLFAIIFPLFGIPFVLVGLYMIFGRFFVDAWVRSRTQYALTDRRALIIRWMFGTRFDSITLRNAPQIRLSMHGRLGDVDFQPQAGGLFGAASWFGGNRWSVWTPALDGRARFTDIPDAAEVHRLAEKARAT